VLVACKQAVTIDTGGVMASCNMQLHCSHCWQSGVVCLRPTSDAASHLAKHGVDHMMWA